MRRLPVQHIETPNECYGISEFRSICIGDWGCILRCLHKGARRCDCEPEDLAMHAAAVPGCTFTYASRSNPDRRNFNRGCTVRHTSWQDQTLRIEMPPCAKSHHGAHAGVRFEMRPSPLSTSSNLQSQHRTLQCMGGTLRQRIAARRKKARAMAKGRPAGDDGNGSRDDHASGHSELVER